LKIWIITYGDGFEFSGQFIEAYDDQTVAELRMLELEEQQKSSYGGYSLEEYEINTKVGWA
jgi:hypothetical protein